MQSMPHDAHPMGVLASAPFLSSIQMQTLLLE